MLFEEIKNEIKNEMQKALYNYNLKENKINFEISEPPLKEYGDFSCNLAFILSKILKKSPYEIANDIVNHILSFYKTQSFVESTFKSISVEKPGFINFKINMNKFLKIFFLDIEKISSIPHYSISNELILIEHTSVNPNKALHVGHVRNSIIGDCLYRLLSYTKHNVKVLNYIDDSGLQVADIIVAFRYANIPIEDENVKVKKFDHYCGNNVYVKINELYSARPELELQRKKVLKDLENPHSEISGFTQKIVKKILINQLQTSWNLKCHYDLLNFESQLMQSNLWTTIFKILQENKIIQLETSGKNIGCWVFKSKEEGDKVLVRSDSTVTYFAKDIPFAIWKLGLVKNPFEFEIFSQQWDNTNLCKTVLKNDLKDKQIDSCNPLIDFNDIKKVITIIDFRQERLQFLLLEILNKLGIDKTKYIYLGYEPVTLSNETAKLIGLKQESLKSKSTQMSGRKGIFIEADIALDLLIKKSYDEIKKRNVDIKDVEAINIAKEIAISAIRYYFVRHDMGKSIVFDIDNSLSLEGNTGPYIQYSYARGKRIYNKLENKSTSHLIENDLEKLEENLSSIEIDLIKHLCRFSTIIKDSINNYEPKLVANYLYMLSTLFNHFYEGSPILKEKMDLKKRLRIKILYSTLLIMQNCMQIIGITALDKM